MPAEPSHLPEENAEDHLEVGARLPAIVNGAAPAASAWPVLPTWEIETNESQVTFGNLMHALRRRFLWAALAAVAAAVPVAALLWWLIPIHHEAASLLHVKSREDRILPVTNPYDRGRASEDYDIFRQTQAALIKSPFVLSAALRKPGIRQLPMLADEENPVGFLEQNVEASYPNNAELLRVSMEGEHPGQLVKLVNAITQAYLEETVHARRRELLQRVEELRRQHVRNRDEIRKGREEIHKIKTQVGAQDSMQARLRHKLELEKLSKLDEERSQLETRIHEVDLKTALIGAATANHHDVKLPAYLIEEQLEADEQYRRLKQELDGAQQQYAFIAATARPTATSVQRAAAHVNLLTRQLKARRQQLQRRIEQKLIDEMAGESNHPATLNMLQTERQILAARLKKVTQAHEEQIAYVRQLDDFNALLDIKQQDLDHLVSTNRAVQAEIHDLTVLLDSPERIRKFQDATVPSSNSRVVKYLQVAAGSLLAVLLTVGGIALWDIHGRRLNNTREISSTAGIQVLGVLPALRGNWRMRWMSTDVLDEVVVESVDSIRTALMRSGHRGHPNRVIMITSATGGEGKTMLASHLATSFARAGRRTLLIDADVHNPQHHEIFGVSGSRGLCDALRGGTDAETFVQPTDYEGLSILPTGQFDEVSQRAMANDPIKMNMKELRGNYDFIVIDAGPVLTSTTPLLLGQLSDANVFSARRDVSRLPKIYDARDRLRAVGIEVLGAVVHGAAAEVRHSGMSKPSVNGHAAHAAEEELVQQT